MISSILKNQILSKKSLRRESNEQDSFQSDGSTSREEENGENSNHNINNGSNKKSSYKKQKKQFRDIQVKQRKKEDDDCHSDQNESQLDILKKQISSDISLRFPKLNFENRSLFDGIENFLKEKYVETNRVKPINFTSRRYKKYVRQMDMQNKEGYQRLKEAIENSYQTVKKVKRGISLQEQGAYNNSVTQNGLPIFDNTKIKRDLEEYLDFQVGTYSNLAPSLKLKVLQNQSNRSMMSIQSNVESQRSLIQPYNNHDRSQTRLLQQEKVNLKGNQLLLNHTVSHDSSTNHHKIQSRNSMLPISKTTLDYDNSQSSLTNSKRNLLTIQKQNSQMSNPYGEPVEIKQIDPKEKYEELKQKFDFPINPAFFHSSVVKQPKRLVSIDSYCKENNIQLTKHQSVQSTLQKIQKEHKFWNEKFSTIIKGYRDTELNDQIVQFVNDIDYANMSQAEMELIFSKEMSMNRVGRTLRNNVQKFFDTNRDKQLLKIAEDSKKAKKDSQSHQNKIKHSYTLLNNTLTRNNNFDLKKVERINEEVALSRRSKTNIKGLNQTRDSNQQSTKGKFSFKMKRPVVQQKKIESESSEDDRDSQDSENDDQVQASFFNSRRQINSNNSKNGSFKTQLQARNNILILKNQQKQLEQNRKLLIVEEHKNQMTQMHTELSSMTHQIEKIEVEDKRRQILKEYHSIREKKESQEKEDIQALKKYLKKHFHKRNIQIAKMINTTDRIQLNNQVMSNKLQKMLDRVEIDRPLLFKEKLEALWKEQDDSKRQMSPEVMQRIYGEELFDTSKISQSKIRDQSQSALEQSTLTVNGGMGTNRNLRQQLEQKKLERMRINGNQKDMYKKVVHTISTRKKDSVDMDIQAEEIRILELMKIILDGGWIIDAQVYEVMIELSGIEDVFNSYMEAVGDSHKYELQNQEKDDSQNFIQDQLHNMSEKVDQKYITVLKTAELISESLALNEYQFLIPRHRKS
eukprot:403333262